MRLPSTKAVDGRSTIELCGLPLKSAETSSSSVASRMPRNEPAAASRNASFTACGVVGLSSSATRSTTDTLAVGTRMAMPSSLPLSLGSTRPTAVAAPVDVRILGGRGDDDFLGAGRDVLAGGGGVPENARRLHHHLHAELLPGQRRRILDGAHADLAPVDEDGLALGGDFGLEVAVDGIVL